MVSEGVKPGDESLCISGSVVLCLACCVDWTGTFALVSILGFNGVLKGDLKGLERVWKALSIRRLFEGRMGDIAVASIEEKGVQRGFDMRSYYMAGLLKHSDSYKSS